MEVSVFRQNARRWHLKSASSWLWSWSTKEAKWIVPENGPIQLVDCEVKKNWHGQGYEVLLKAALRSTSPKKKLDVSRLKDDATDTSKPISLEELQAIDNFEQVTVLFKAISTNPPDTVNDIPHQDVFLYWVDAIPP